MADDAAGTVTFNLSVPWGPLLATAAGPLGGLVLDMEWAIENGAWDGSCDTWQNFYAPGHENTELGSIVNGTGPYKLETWAPDIGYTLVANEDYWRTEPIWESGPSGVARIPTVVVQVVDEWGTRFARAQVGDADFFTVLPDNRAQVDQFVGEFCNWVTDECVPDPDNPDGPFRKYGALPSVSKSHVFMLFDIPPDSPFIGSGELDGDGIPTDFFADLHVRKAMHYCFDHETFIAEVLNGDGVRTNGPIINDMLGYPEDGPQYDFDLDACEAELEQAHGGLLPETGFRFSAVFNTGNTTRQSALEILQANLASINPDYQLEIVGLPWPGFLHAFRASQIPLLSSGWIEDIHDPHNWAQPFTAGIFANRQRIPDDIRDQFNELVTAGVSSSDPAERQAIYEEMQQLFYDLAISVPLSQVTDAHYEQRWMKDFYHRVGRFGFFFYGYDQEG